MKLIEETDRWIVTVPGWKVERCLIDYAFSVQLIEGNDDVTARIEADFVLNTGGWVEFKLSPSAPTELYPALSMLHKPVVSVVAYKSGTLEIRFIEDTSLVVEPNSEYEAWTLTSKRGVGSGGLLIVCMPGGSLAVWEPNP